MVACLGNGPEGSRRSTVLSILIGDVRLPWVKDVVVCLSACLSVVTCVL